MISYTTLLLMVVLSFCWLKLKSKITKSIYFGVTAYLSMLCVGILIYTLNYKTLSKFHYLNTCSDDGALAITLKISERLKPDSYNFKYIGEILTINNSPSKGNLLINIKRDSLSVALGIDDIIYIKTNLKSITKPLNPHQFNYERYMQLRQIYHQIYVSQQGFLKVNHSSKSIYGYADAFRNKIIRRLQSSNLDQDVVAMTSALLLGQRQSINPKIYTNYINSGTVHILAVSGLHVGIILWLLNFLLQPLLHLKNGRILKSITIVLLLWMFAFITGLSPSVTRAVTMFSIISIAMHYKRATNIYNTIFISAFLILLVKPNFLFHVGFQMSYIALLAIVTLQPLFYKFWSSKYWLTDKLWQIFTVTLAAQIGVLPISLFYFHQFPALFFISNMVVIPFLGIILSLGLLTIIWSLCGQLPELLVNIYNFIIKSLNTFIAWVADFEEFLIKDISFSLIQVFCSYAFMLFVLKAYKTKRLAWMFGCMVSIIGFLGVELYHNHNNQHDKFIVFNKSRQTIIGSHTLGKFTAYHNLDSLALKKDKVLNNYKTGQFIHTVHTDTLASVYQFKSKLILVIDSLGIYKKLSFKPDYIVLRSAPKINLDRLISELDPKLIIADASNFKTFIKRWELTCLKRKIPFHYTNEKGAFILE